MIRGSAWRPVSTWCAAAILASWQPAVMGGLRSVPLRPWCDEERVFFEAADAETRAAIEAVRADYGVQSHFGKRWFANIILNLPGAARGPAPLPRGNEAIVTAAGPSLELSLGRLAAERVGRMLVATDTSLPALLRSGIVPDAVLSIDCQNHGYHHFLQGKPPEAMLFLDLASPPLLARQGASRQAPVLRGKRPSLHAVCLLPLASAAAHRHVGGKCHPRRGLAGLLPGGATGHGVRGGLLLPGWARRTRGERTCMTTSGRTRAGCLGRVPFLFVRLRHRGSARREVRDGRVLYTTPVLDGYRDRFRGLIESLDAEVIRVQGDDPVMPGGRGTTPSGPAPVPLPGPLPAQTWTEFLTEYSRSVERLPSFSATSPGPERELWYTSLPVAARVVKEGHEPGPGALEEARRWSLERVQRVLRSR